MRGCRTILWSLGVAGAHAAVAIAAPPGAVDFNREVRPVLAEHCFECHGPDASARQADFRLDRRDSAFDADTLWSRITAPHDDERMPPPEAGAALAPAELATLRRWIDAGAGWREHWSFEAPVRPAPPVVGDAAWVRNPIDRFVLARLESEGLTPAPAADRRTLIRRLSYDLTGLPPTAGEIRAYLADVAPGADDRLVERLLASPHYGERMALRWLDLARYADTNGYSIDGGRHMWAWRDWVIDAYNDNMPFDRFTVEQLAGDLLPGATTAQRIASGFNRNHMNTHEGGTIAAEYLVAYTADRVKTTTQTWMGLTMGCAQCHDHKYDPISQTEYYRFFAYFNTITDKGNDGNAGVNSVPFIPVFSREQRAERALLMAERDRLRAQLAAPRADVDDGRRAWEAAERAAARVPPELGSWHVIGPFAAESGQAAFTTDFGPEGGVDYTVTYPAGEAERRWTERPDLADGTPHPLAGERAAWYLHRTLVTKTARPLTLSLGSDDAIRAWFNGAPVLDADVQRGVAPDQERVTVEMRPGVNELLLKIVNYGGPAGFYFAVAPGGPPPEIAALVTRAPDDRTPRENDAVRAFYRTIAPELADLRAAIAACDERVAAIGAKPLTTAMVMEEMAMPRATFVLERGQYDRPGAEVEPGVPSCLPPLPADAPSNRLGLARWLVDPAHPLTARVAVNGLWQMVFGTGLVETAEDFGVRGAPPSHPDLLDWLAVELVESGWDVRAMMRLLVGSATYRQDSSVTPALRERDPGNRLLARGPRFRLAAELVRDTALAAGGLLVDDIGGPSVRPYQPPGLWKEMSHFGSTPATEQVYTVDEGDKLYRRSLYTIWKRTVPPPTMVAFDAPNRELCTVRRARTNTPLQALVLLNETGFVEAARALAERMMTEGGAAPAARLAHGFELTTGRRPDDAERAILLGAFAREHARYRGDLDAAAALLAVGASPRDTTLDPAEHAAWTVVANLLLNLSETITKG